MGESESSTTANSAACRKQINLLPVLDIHPEVRSESVIQLIIHDGTYGLQSSVQIALDEIPTPRVESELGAQAVFELDRIILRGVRADHMIGVLAEPMERARRKNDFLVGTVHWYQYGFTLLGVLFRAPSLGIQSSERCSLTYVFVCIVEHSEAVSHVLLSHVIPRDPFPGAYPR
jgi:hypothetical protein